MLSLLTAQAPYLLTLLATHRREVIPAAYPPLSIEEEDTRERLEVFLASYDSLLAAHVDTLATSVTAMTMTASMQQFLSASASASVSSSSVPCQEQPGQRGEGGGVFMAEKHRNGSSGSSGSSSPGADRQKTALEMELEFFWEE